MGNILRNSALFIFFASSLWGLVISSGIVIDHFGFIGFIISFVVAPITIMLAPWYELFANSNWFPLLIIYGGFAVGSILYTVGNAIDADPYR